MIFINIHENFRCPWISYILPGIHGTSFSCISDEPDHNLDFTKWWVIVCICHHIHIHVKLFGLHSSTFSEYVHYRYNSFSYYRFSFVISRQGEIRKVFHSPEKDPVLIVKKGLAALMASKLHKQHEVNPFEIHLLFLWKYAHIPTKFALGIFLKSWCLVFI